MDMLTLTEENGDARQTKKKSDKVTLIQDVCQPPCTMLFNIEVSPNETNRALLNEGFDATFKTLAGVTWKE